MKKLLFIFIVSVASLWMPACQSGGGSNERKAATDTVVISGMQFRPDTLQVTAGDTMVWINQDLVAHNVTEFPAAAWASDTIAVGASWKKVISASFDYNCSIHPTMKGRVIVDKP